ncbi:MAG: hypothetical protein GX126_07125 [Bacteroidales bacterium]|nr:hypothetical protein [Bacteroidales bacterium]
MTCCIGLAVSGHKPNGMEMLVENYNRYKDAQFRTSAADKGSFSGSHYHFPVKMPARPPIPAPRAVHRASGTALPIAASIIPPRATIRVAIPRKTTALS